MQENTCSISSVDEVMKILKNMRIHLMKEEYTLQDTVARQLALTGISFVKEYRLAPRNRVDFFLEDGIILEIKKGKPNRRQVLAQLGRYTAFREVKAVILVVERNLDIPASINGKRCVSLGLNRLWGVALK